MCGPIVFAQNKLTSKSVQSMLLPYHMGRLFTYVLLGVIASAFSQFLIGTPVHRYFAATLLVLAGGIFLLHALPFLKEHYRLNLPRAYVTAFHNITGRFFPAILNNSGMTSRFLTGVLLGFLPCGLVVAAVMAVAATGDMMTAALGMAAFGLSTIPVLLSIGLGAQAVRSRWPNQTKIASTWTMALSGLALMVTGYGLLTSGLTL